MKGIILIVLFQALSCISAIGQNAGRYVRTDYQYDLISNKVTQVNYQAKKGDQLYHKYEYDSDNRITHVYISIDNVTWALQAKYFYYGHGPLARVEIGSAVQGVDYAYTLQNWLKGVNSNTLVSNRDIGADGVSGLHRHFADDVAGYSLGYHSNDYTAIHSPSEGSFVSATAGSDLAVGNLYNGNISHVVIANRVFMSGNGSPLGTSYTYDQLNRIKTATSHVDANVVGTNAWSATTATNDYKEGYSYDANGNLLTQHRNAHGTNLNMEDLRYVYENKANGYERNTNRLRQVTDLVPANQWDDIESQLPENYDYDAIGNLIKDNSEGISAITWTLGGKVKQVTKTNGTILIFSYDAQGNRVSKELVTPSETRKTFYLRDASGNFMALYEKDQTGLKLIEQPIYGSDRLGQRNQTVILSNQAAQNGDSTHRYFLGHTSYEFKNHLDNVLAVYSDRTVWNGSKHITELTAANDYSSFGALRPGRSFSSKPYRFGFQGQEKDDEIKGNGNSYSFTYRIYDPRVGRFLSVDPIANSFPWNSPYSFVENRPIDSKEMEGMERYHYTYDLVNGQYKINNFMTEHMDKEGLGGALAYNLFGMDYKESHLLHYEGAMYEFGSKAEMNDFDPENPGDKMDLIPLLETVEKLEQINAILQEIADARGNSRSGGTRKSAAPQIRQSTNSKVQAKTATAAKSSTNQKITTTIKSSAGGTKTISGAKKITQTGTINGWKVGDPINNRTFKGAVPSWSTVRARYWKNRALNSSEGEFSPENKVRMQKGLAPQRVNPQTGKTESMELHHDPPQRDGGMYDVVEVWPSEHAAIDPYRQTGDK